MKKVLLSVLVAAAALGTTSAAQAASPHYVQGPSATVQGNALVVTFKAAGLGNTVAFADFNLTGTVDVFSRCYNNGGNKPQADNKQETIAVNESATFPVRNGQTTGRFEIAPLSSLTCPGKQVVVIESVSYNLTLTGDGLGSVNLSG